MHNKLYRDDPAEDWNAPVATTVDVEMLVVPNLSLEAVPEDLLLSS